MTKLQQMLRRVQQDIEAQAFRVEVEFAHGYHVARPVNALDEWPHMMRWMIDTFGPTAKDGIWTPGQRWYANNARFWFRQEQDLMLFVMKWQK